MRNQIVRADIVRVFIDGERHYIGKIICTIGYIHDVIDGRHDGIYCIGYEVSTTWRQLI